MSVLKENIIEDGKYEIDKLQRILALEIILLTRIFSQKKM